MKDFKEGFGFYCWLMRSGFFDPMLEEFGDQPAHDSTSRAPHGLYFSCVQNDTGHDANNNVSCVLQEKFHGKK
jgi:hypothetical protein